MHHPTDSRGALAGTRNSSLSPLHEGSIRRPIAPLGNALTTELHLAPLSTKVDVTMPKLIEKQRHNVIRRLQTGKNQSDVARCRGVCTATINRL